MAKRIKINLMGGEEKIIELVGRLNADRVDFEIQRTGYTCKIIVPSENKDYFFSTSGGSKSFLFFSSKLKSEVKDQFYPDARNGINYYNFGAVGNLLPEMYCVDLNSAYLQSAFNEKMISEDCFTYGNKLSKNDRLKGFGSLATLKTIYSMTAGEVSNVKIVRSPTESVFFQTCKNVGKLLSEAVLIGDSFVFYWVDGIYVANLKDAELIADFFEAHHFPSKLEHLTDCKLSPNKTLLSYNKEGKRKIFTLPKKYSKLTDEKIIDFLTENDFGAETTIKNKIR